MEGPIVLSCAIGTFCENRALDKHNHLNRRNPQKESIQIMKKNVPIPTFICNPSVKMLRNLQISYMKWHSPWSDIYHCKKKNTSNF